MKPFINCPYCGCNLKEIKQNEHWHEKYCPDQCMMKFHQYFDGDFTSDKLRYITFDTARFNVYVYFDKGFYANICHFYSHNEMRLHGHAMPVVENLPANRIPVQELADIIAEYPGYDHSMQVREWLARVDEKLYTLALFT